MEIIKMEVGYKGTLKQHNGSTISRGPTRTGVINHLVEVAFNEK